ncbi:DCC1-like thiol-disulfide oxidoreductase family protein [Corynebacterium pseudopelargi]|uniref:Thiol-disulfide oxidoreductase n=1 Tax=Corynebacterium pseudopelargi TaxID=2080757 RepID=A0A3G6IWF9_9CORY|nr:hypothetical protein CPPEL_01365 [Corynebacterium pseudopelargi]
MGTFVYDADCGLCTRLVNFCKPRTTASFATTWDTQVDLNSTALWVEQGEEYVEHEAIAQLLLHMKKPWPLLGQLIRLLPYPARAFYRWVARNRPTTCRQAPGRSER